MATSSLPRNFGIADGCMPAFVGTILVIALLTYSPTCSIAQTEGDYLYRVTMLRATPGHFTDLISSLQQSFELEVEAGDRAPFWIRHSQGDQWDFMLIYPMDDNPAYFDTDRVTQRISVWESSRGQELNNRLSEYSSYREDWFARSVHVDELEQRFDGMGLFHVEMFAGLPGKREELLEQRRMENRYYQHLDRQQNVIFAREAGSNWDSMTIGFHESLATFAEAGGRYSAEQQDEAARVAGFGGVDAISPYLRSLLSYHNDTLGVPAQ